MAVTPRRRYAPRLPREQRREQLLDATLALIAAQGFGAVSMEAVAREVGIAKTVVYDAFGNREALLRALFEREQARVHAAIDAAMPALPPRGEPLELLVESLVELLRQAGRHPETWRLILLPIDGAPPALRASIADHRERLVRRMEPIAAWGAQRLGASSLDPELLAETLVATAEHGMRLTLAAPERYPPERVAGFARDMLLAITPRR